MANNIVQINSNNGINVTTQTSNDIISVVALGPQGPQGPQGEPGSGFPFDGGIAQITGSLQVTGSTILTGSLNVSEGITGSLLGTSSWAQNSITASYALNASGVDTSSLVTTSSFNSFTSSIQSFTQSIQSSVNSLTNSTSSYLLRSETSSLTQLSTFNNFTSSYTTGSFTGSFTGSLLGTASKVIIGDLGINVYPIAIASPSGDILKVDAFTLNNNSKFLNLPNDYTLLMQGTSTVSAGTFSGNLSGNVTGNLTGTASFATSASRALNSNSASFATTASYVLNAISASYIQNAQSASYVLNAISSSFTTTASYALNGGVTFPYTGSALITGSLTITGSTTSTLGFTGSLLGTASRAVSSSYALTASYALSSAGGGGGTSLGSIFITLYDGGSNLTTGIKDTPAYIPYDGTATGWEMLAYNSSNVLMTASCVVDILQGRFATLPLSGSNSMAGSEKPTLTNQSSSFSSSLSTWTSITAGDYVQAEIESVSTGVAKIVIAIKTTKSS
jgi:hypothetical protein